jgi:RNA polymerase-binding transcription factor DksA
MSVPAAVAGVLTPHQLADLHAQLIEQKAFRERQLRSLARVGAAYGATHREIAEALTVAARTALRDVEDALTRMRTGRYGRCVDCGGLMPTGRLEVLPQVARCMPCQREAEPG